jgi:hypothetical protein
LLIFEGYGVKRKKLLLQGQLVYSDARERAGRRRLVG